MAKNEPIKMTVAAGYTLFNVVEKILFTAEGKERTLPLTTKYKLLRARDMLEKDTFFFEEQRRDLVKELGEDKDNGTIQVTDDKLDEFNARIKNILEKETEHTFMSLTPEEVLSFGDVELSVQELSLLASALVDDPKLTEDINTSLDSSDKE